MPAPARCDELLHQMLPHRVSCALYPATGGRGGINSFIYAIQHSVLVCLRRSPFDTDRIRVLNRHPDMVCLNKGHIAHRWTRSEISRATLIH